jgi:hypothetical protein
MFGIETHEFGVTEHTTVGSSLSVSDTLQQVEGLKTKITDAVESIISDCCSGNFLSSFLFSSSSFENGIGCL